MTFYGITIFSLGFSVKTSTKGNSLVTDCTDWIRYKAMIDREPILRGEYQDEL